MNTENTFSITSNNIPFNINLIFHNDHYGLNNCLTYKAIEPMVEFYDARYPHTEHGQFVARYYITTLMEENDNRGLCLDGGVPDWNIDGQSMATLKEWLKNHDRLSKIVNSLPPKKPLNFSLEEEDKPVKLKF